MPSTKNKHEKQFIRAICHNEWVVSDLDGIPSLDDACGAGSSDVNLGAEDYISIIEDAIDILEDAVGLTIPEEEIDIDCEVKLMLGGWRGGGGTNNKRQCFYSTVYTPWNLFSCRVLE